MSETLLEKWMHRIRDAWRVLTGRAIAVDYEAVRSDCILQPAEYE